jgi:hypothetical protein
LTGTSVLFVMVLLLSLHILWTARLNLRSRNEDARAIARLEGVILELRAQNTEDAPAAPWSGGEKQISCVDAA